MRKKRRGGDVTKTLSVLAVIGIVLAIGIGYARNGGDLESAVSSVFSGLWQAIVYVATIVARLFDGLVGVVA